MIWKLSQRGPLKLLRSPDRRWTESPMQWWAITDDRWSSVSWQGWRWMTIARGLARTIPLTAVEEQVHKRRQVSEKVPRHETWHIHWNLKELESQYLPTTGIFKLSLKFSDTVVHRGTLFESSLQSLHYKSLHCNWTVCLLVVGTCEFSLLQFSLSHVAQKNTPLLVRSQDTTYLRASFRITYSYCKMPLHVRLFHSLGPSTSFFSLLVFLSMIPLILSALLWLWLLPRRTYTRSKQSCRDL